MTFPRLAAVLAPLAMCAACTPQDEPATTPPPPVATTEPGCGADQLGGYIGRKATDELIASLRAWRGEHPIRVLKPGAIVTMDYRADRLNIELDEDGVIKAVRCT